MPIECTVVMSAVQETCMLKLLKKLHQEHTYSSFDREKVTPDVVCLLSAHEMSALGVTSHELMMRLRAECNKYGMFQPRMRKSNCGPPEFHIPKSQLEFLLEEDFKISDIAKLLSVSESTVYHKMGMFGLTKLELTHISDEDLDLQLGPIVKDFPRCGEIMLKNILKTRGIFVQRWRLRESIHHVDYNGVKQRKSERLHRRVYSVEGPNHLWHIDTNHKLIRWGFIIVGGIDGFSRLIMYLKCTNKNKAGTLLDCFKAGVAEYGLPRRVEVTKG